MYNVNDIIARLKRVETESRKLSTKLGIGEDIHIIVNNILKGNIKTEYTILVNEVAIYVIEHPELLLVNNLQKFIVDYKLPETSELIIQSTLNSYMDSKLIADEIEVLHKLFKDDSLFFNNLPISTEIALVTHSYKNNSINNIRRYSISEVLESECYAIAIAIYGIDFVYNNVNAINKLNINAKYYANIINSMMRQGLTYSKEHIYELNTLFKGVTLEKDPYRDYIDNSYKNEYISIIKQLLNLDTLRSAGFDRNRFDFWKDYISSGEFKMHQGVDILTIKFNNYFIVEQGGYLGGYVYILNNFKYDYVLRLIKMYDLPEIKRELNQMSLGFGEYRKRHTNGTWEINVRKTLNEQNIYTDTSKYIIHNREIDERKKLTPSLRYKILKRDNYKCQICGKLLNDSKFHIDHIYPISRGGKTVEENLQATCARCNLSKGAKIIF